MSDDQLLQSTLYMVYFHHSLFHVCSLSIFSSVCNQSVLTESKCYYNVYYRVPFLQSYLHLCLILLLHNVDLINSHKQVTPHVSGSGSHVSSMSNNISNKSKSSFSWQRTKHPAKEKKQAATVPPRSHSYSLDRRKMTNSSSGRSSRIV